MAATFAELVRKQRGPLPGGRFRRTQEQCAATLGIHVSTWRAWEAGRRCPRTQEAVAFAAKFRIDELEIFQAIERQGKDAGP